MAQQHILELESRVVFTPHQFVDYATHYNNEFLLYFRPMADVFGAGSGGATRVHSIINLPGIAKQCGYLTYRCIKKAMKDKFQRSRFKRVGI